MLEGVETPAWVVGQFESRFVRISICRSRHSTSSCDLRQELQCCLSLALCPFPVIDQPLTHPAG
jgi:hypothetical protein